MEKHYKIRVHGRVQGVFFRASTQEKAHEVGVKGYVKNEPDGTVYIEAEGPPESLDRFVEWCHEGPPAAKVDKVDKEEAEEPGNFQRFEVR